MLRKRSILTFLISASALLAGCSDSVDSKAGDAFDDGSNNSNNTGNEISFDKNQLLTDLVDGVFVPANDNFVVSASNQADAIEQFCQNLTTNQAENPELKQQAQASWRQAMNSWQQIEMMQIGPLLDNEATLRNQIYSWPVVNHCAVDQDVGNFEAGSISGTPYDITKRTPQRRGLDALEYLLFNPQLNHSCSSDSFAPSGWNQRSELERQIARCNFAVEVAKDIENSATQLQTEWNQTDGFATTLKQAGQAGNPYESAQQAINDITDALFYLDKITKDAKLGSPIGLITNSCGSASCVNDIESGLSNNAINNIKHNLIAFKTVFIANQSDNEAKMGFDDFLVAAEASELADTMITDLDTAIALTEQFEGTMAQAVTDQPEQVQALYQAVKVVTDNLKSLFITYLALDLPSTSAGDAD